MLNMPSAAVVLSATRLSLPSSPRSFIPDTLDLKSQDNKQASGGCCK
jgi:hypothetical protein